MGIVGTELESVALSNGTFSLKTADELQIACRTARAGSVR